jgi:hypothetical protein
MYRAYFDGNDGTEENLYGLWLDKSKEDLAAGSRVNIARLAFPLKFASRGKAKPI